MTYRFFTKKIEQAGSIKTKKIINFWWMRMFVFNKLKKQPSRGVLKKRCSENMQQSYRRTPMPKCDFNKVAKLQSNFNEITLRQGCSSENLVHIFRTPFLNNTSGRLLLKLLFSTSSVSNELQCSISLSMLLFVSKF